MATPDDDMPLMLTHVRMVYDKHNMEGNLPEGVVLEFGEDKPYEILKGRKAQWVYLYVDDNCKTRDASRAATGFERINVDHEMDFSNMDIDPEGCKDIAKGKEYFLYVVPVFDYDSDERVVEVAIVETKRSDGPWKTEGAQAMGWSGVTEDFFTDRGNQWVQLLWRSTKVF